jgi:hypothetical protein
MLWISDIARHKIKEKRAEQRREVKAASPTLYARIESHRLIIIDKQPLIPLELA